MAIVASGIGCLDVCYVCVPNVLTGVRCRESEQRQCQGGPGVRGVRLTDEGDGKEGPLSPGSKAYLYVSLWPSSYYDHHLNVVEMHTIIDE